MTLLPHLASIIYSTMLALYYLPIVKIYTILFGLVQTSI